jgi:hypothetical protein
MGAREEVGDMLPEDLELEADQIVELLKVKLLQSDPDTWAYYQELDETTRDMVDFSLLGAYSLGMNTVSVSWEEAMDKEAKQHQLPWWRRLMREV